ncbi:uncharacterized protein LOC113307838 [Papaver somniferum]|uniref:uncharacterized protein LOC113307838 n=1 Tax=Papaver somniferum TaxID=3469 RepID=UPI000E6FE22B|nr:uncharacterized protein LOC113307838 [Papaver somniferum]XP_026412083.1 uncharacterized protein LOC113307838 [Papaver somniferum]
MLVEKKKNKIRVVGAHVANQKVQDNSKGVTNRFASLDEQNSFDQTDLNVAHQRSINAQNNNSCNFNGAMHGGNYEGFTKKLQNKEVNDNNSGIGNKGVVQASLRKSFNHKNINTTNKGSGKGINGGQFNDQMPICKGKGIMQASTSVSNNQENGRKQPTDSNVFKSLSRAIGGAVEGRGFSSEASTGRTSGNAESSDRDNNRTNLKGGYQTATNGRHCSDEKSVESCITNSSTYTRADGLEFIFGQNPSNSDSIKNLTFKLDTHGPEEFLNHGKEELECVSRMWQESTTLEVELAPMVETPALVKSPSDILKFEMHFTTHLDAEMLYQRQFKTRFNPLLELNKAAVARRMEMQVPRGPSRSVSIPKCFNNLSMKILVRNCRGAARLSFISVMKKLIKRHKPTIVDLLETKVLSSHAVRIVRQLGPFESILVDPEGFSGRMCLMWNPDEVDIQTTKKSRWAAHAVVTAKLQSPWILSTIMEVPIRLTERGCGVNFKLCMTFLTLSGW